MRLFYTIFFFVCVITLNAQSTWTDFLSMENPPVVPPGELYVPSQIVIASGAVNFYMDEARFISSCAESGMVTEEDFISTSFTNLGHAGCPGSINSATDNLCFNPGDVQEGISIRSSGESADEFILITQGDFNIPSNGVGPNYFTDNTVIEFSVPVNSIGIEFIAPLHLDSVYTFSAYSSSMTLLGSADFSSNGITPVFVGVLSNELISQITITSPGRAGEIITNITYGQCAQLASVPTLGQWGLLSLGIVIMIFGVSISKQYSSQVA